MKYLIESNKFYKKGDFVLIEYWYNGMVTVVEVIDFIGRKILVSHNNEYSKIKNAPNELIKPSDIIQKKNS